MPSEKCELDPFDASLPSGSAAPFRTSSPKSTRVKLEVQTEEHGSPACDTSIPHTASKTAREKDFSEYEGIDPYQEYILEEGPLLCEGVQEIIIDTKSFFRSTAGCGSTSVENINRESRFVCDHCDTWFSNRSGVQVHIFMFHMGDRPREQLRKRGRRYRCVKCHKMCLSLPAAQKHYQHHRHVAKPHHGGVHKQGSCGKSIKQEPCADGYQVRSQASRSGGSNQRSIKAEAGHSGSTHEEGQEDDDDAEDLLEQELQRIMPVKRVGVAQSAMERHRKEPRTSSKA
ncbi:zinc finger protein [Aphelenchoides avenae]|nr:zinc finger protein [Aphelenchus avenae]